MMKDNRQNRLLLREEHPPTHADKVPIGFVVPTKKNGVFGAFFSLKRNQLFEWQSFLLATILFCSLDQTSLAQPGSLDVTFDPGTGANARIKSVAYQPDGKLLIGGDFTTYNGTARNRVARLNADGSLDASFNPGTGANLPIYSVAYQQDGKVLIGGLFTTYNGTARSYFARLNADGSLDATFNPSGTGANSWINSVAYQPDGKVLIGGALFSYNGTARNNIARINADGSLDGTFNPGTGTNAQIYSVAYQPDGKVLIGGLFTLYNGTTRNRIARLNADGSLDGSFNPGTGANNGVIWSVGYQPDGKVLIGGYFTEFNGTTRNKIARINADGSLDGSFNPGTGANSTDGIRSVVYQSDGKVLIGGHFTEFNGTITNRIARLNADGSVDGSFNSGGVGAGGDIYSLAYQPDGKVLIGGDFTSYNSTGRNRIARLLGDTQTPPAAPVGTAATAITTTGFTANWNAATDATGYQLDISSDNFVTFIAGYNSKAVTTTTEVVTGLTASTAYKYRVRATNASGTSGNSNVIDVTTLTGGTPPPAPTSLIASFVSNTGFELSWDGLPGITEYRIDVSSDNFATFAAGWQNAAATFQAPQTGRAGWSVLNLLPSTAYKVRIRAVNSGGASPNSAAISFTTIANPAMISPNLWVNTIGASGNQTFVNALANDAAGNVYAVGKFGGSITLGSTTLTSVGDADVYFAKYNAAGVVQWAKSIGGTGPDEGWQIAVDASGVYISGVFDATVDFNPDAGVTSIATRGAANNPRLTALDDGFIAKYNLSNGSFVWAQSLGDAWPEYYSRALTTDNNNGVFLTGMFTGTNDFDPGAGTTNLSAAGGPDIFITRFDATTGNLSWAKAMGGADWDAGTALLTDGNNLFATGWYYGAIDLDPGAATINVTGAGTFLNKFVSATGDLTFAKNFTNTGNYLDGYDLAKDGTHIYILGDLGGSVDMDPDAGVSTISGNGGFLAKYTLSSGSFVWANMLRANNYMLPTRVIADQTGLYVGGTFAWLADFEPGAGEANRVGNNSDIFIARYGSSDGAFQWAKNIGGTGSEALRASMTLTNDGLYIGGIFQNTVNFDPYTNTMNKTAVGSSDGFIAKYQSVSPAPPVAPVATVATAISSTGFTANWNAVAGATGYQLDISADNFSTLIAGYNSKNVTGTTEVVVGLTATTAYKYRVRASNIAGNSGNSNVIDVATGAAGTAPVAPVATTATVISTTGFTANWNAVSGATGYQLDISADNFATFLAGYNSKAVTATTEVVTGLTASTAYKYRVRATNVSGTSASSNVIDVTTGAAGTAPVAPVATTASVISSTGFTANWNVVSGATGYQLDISTDNFSTFIAGYNSKAVTATTEVVTGLTASTAYKYRVRATNTSGSSASSNVIDVNTGAAGTAPATPVAIAATTISPTGFTANWNVVSGATGYQLDISADNFATFLTGYNSKSVTATTEVVTGLTASTAYKYRVRATNASGSSASSNVIDVTTGATGTAPVAPVATSATIISSTGFTANWNSVTGATGYQLDISADNFATFLTGYSSKSVTAITEVVAGLTASTTYKYRVRATNASGTSANSNVIDVTTASGTKQNQTITFTAITDKTLGGLAFPLTATSSSSLPVSYTTTSDKITITGSQVTLVKAGRASITASQAGDAIFNAAPSVEQNFCIKPAKPIVTTTGANTETITLTSSASAGNQWFKDGSAITGATNATLPVTTVGVYKVQVKVDDCLSEFSEDISFIITGDLNAQSNGITIYPNPVEDFLEVRGLKGDVGSSQLSDMTGRTSTIVLEKKDNVHRANVQHLSQGVYLMRVQEGTTVHQIKFIKK